MGRYENARKFAYKVTHDGDRENANKDASLNSTKQALIAEGFMKDLVREEMPREWIRAHEEGYIHIHDLGNRFLDSHNCNLFDMGNVLREGFELAGIQYKEPGGVQSAFAVAGDVVLSASAQQYGGFTISEVDKLFATYAEKTYEKAYGYYKKETGDESLSARLAYDMTVREVRQGYQGFETKLNTVSSALGQIPFVTISFGLGTGEWERLITRTILETRMEGLGKKGTTAVFPKLVFLHRKEIADGPNGDLKTLALECSRKRLYPDFLSLDEGYLKEVYEESGKPISPMGCRAYLSRFHHPKTGEMIFEGRGNIGAVTLNLPLYALETKEESAFFEMIDRYAEMVFAIHHETYRRVGQAKGASNPLFYCEGGAWMSVGYDEYIAPVIEAFTASLGYIGLEEVCHALFGSGLDENQAFGVKVLTHLASLVETYRERDGHLYALYATPAESLIERFQTMNRRRHGVVQGVTDKAYMSNSFHQHVTKKHVGAKKMLLEKPMFDISTGGRIQYCEYPFGVDLLTLRQHVDLAMKLGLYHGINIESATCQECGHQGEFHTCPKCGSGEVTSVNRCCGYLSFDKVKGKTRYNEGKRAEIKDRVDHV